MNFGNRFLRREHNDLLILVDDILDGTLAFDDLIERRVSQLIQRNLSFLTMILRLVMTIFWLGSPFSHGKCRICLAELCEDQISVFVESL